MQIAKVLIDRSIQGGKAEWPLCHELLPFDVDEDTRAEVIQCSYMNGDSGTALVKITDNKSVCANVMGVETSDIKGNCSIMKTGRNQYLATIQNNNCKIARMVSESGCFLVSVIPKSKNEFMWTLLSPKSADITKLVKKLRDEGIGAEKVSSGQTEVDTMLTDKQEEILMYAYNHGYYDVPKRINTDELCRVFDCSKSTLSVIIRSAEKRIIESYLDTGRNMQKYY